MDKIRMVIEVDEDIYDELCSYADNRVTIVYAEDATIPKNESGIVINE